jgi:hypothetical protein
MFNFPLIYMDSSVVYKEFTSTPINIKDEQTQE